MSSDFKSKQAEFAAYIRDPRRNPPPAGMEPLRMSMYRELFFNNIDSFISSNFPVIRTILNDRQWLELTESFYAGHSCRTPHFSEIAEEFLDYLQHRHNPDDYPFLLELAHYEWVEMALSISRAEAAQADITFIENFPSRIIALSPLAWPLAYRFPVHRISAEYLPLEPPPQPTYIVVHRDRDDDLHFLQATPLTFRLLNILEERDSLTCDKCLQLLSAETHHIEANRLYEEGLAIIRNMIEKGIIIPGHDA